VETHLADFVRDTAEGRDAEAILRACVHCGFCTATCPTYQLLGDELDGPRGRIYLVKQMLEGATVSAKTRLHLDRCLTCGACETICPSGVRYVRLADIGRRLVEELAPRPARERLHRWLLRRALLSRPLFALALGAGRALRPILPRPLTQKLPPRRKPGAWPPRRHNRTMLVLRGCVQPALAPSIDAAMARLLDRIGVSLVCVAGSGCCGAISEHLAAGAEARRFMRANIDAWWPHVEQGAEAIVATASGCGVLLKAYGELLHDDPAYAERAQRIASLVRDPVEIVAAEWKRLTRLVAMDRGSERVALHTPCTLQHGQRLGGRIEEILEALGLELTPVADAHLCCGSAGTYALLQPELAEALRSNKVAALEAGEPDLITTANIGCLLHIGAATKRPVRHWIEVLESRLRTDV
jgi:glycolate oxidase iron-sulfur subunit